MAKLPGINYNAPVQSLGRENINIPAQKANQNVGIAELAINSLASFAQNKIKKTFDYDTEQANNNLAVAKSQVMDSMSRLLMMESYSPEELDEAIEFEGVKKGIAEDGTEIETTRKSIPASEVNPQLFEQTMKNIRSQAAEGLSPESAKMLDKKFDTIYFAARQKMVNDNFTKSVKDREIEVIQSSMQLANSGDFAGAAMNIQASNMAPAIKMEQIKKIDMLSEDSQILSSVNNQNILMMKYNLDRMKDDNYDGPYNAQKRKSAINDLEKGIDSALLESEEIETRKRAKDYANLNIAASRGEVNYIELENAFDNGTIQTATQYSSLVKTLDRVIEEKEKESNDLIDVSKVLSTDAMFSPTNKDQRKAVNTFFLENASPQMALSLAKKGIVPKAVIDKFTAFNRGGSPKQVADVARLYANMVAVAPKAMEDIPERHRNDMANMSELINSNVPPDEAVNILDKWANRSDSEKEIINKRYVADVLGGQPGKMFIQNQQRELQSKLNGDDNYDKYILSSAPEPSAAMVAEYDLLKRRYYQSFDDMSKASARAYETLTTTWGFTEVNGNQQIMKYAPEVRYNMPTKAIKSQLTKEMKDIGIKKDVRLVATSATAKNLVYQISDAEGFPVFGKDNLPILWKPDYDAYIKSKKANEAAAQKAKKEAAIQEREQRSAEKPNSRRAVGFYSNKVRDIYK
jgi:hypothetical protein